MSQTSKVILTAIASILLAGGGVYLWQQREANPNFYNNIAKYNCEKSSGTFGNDGCVCPLEMSQTQEMMYDTTTGYCQSTIGGPSGDAFAASVGLPYGSFAFWVDIVSNKCEETGGEWNTVAQCTCSNGAIYDKPTGSCITK